MDKPCAGYYHFLYNICKCAWLKACKNVNISALDEYAEDGQNLDITPTEDAFMQHLKRAALATLMIK